MGPLIFSLYVNDMPNYLYNGIVPMFANGTTIIVSGKNSKEVMPIGVSEIVYPSSRNII